MKEKVKVHAQLSSGIRCLAYNTPQHRKRELLQSPGYTVIWKFSRGFNFLETSICEVSGK